MTSHAWIAVAAAFAALAAIGCADSNNILSTASVAGQPDKVAAAAVGQSKTDPACAALASQIDTLRHEGSIDRLEKASAGKGSSVSVKRATLAKQAEYNRVTAEYQAKCSLPIPRAQTAQAQPAAPAAGNAVASAAVNAAENAAANAAQSAVTAGANKATAAAAQAIAKQ